MFSGLLLCFGFSNMFLHLPVTVSNGRKITHLEMYPNEYGQGMILNLSVTTFMFAS